MIQIFGDFSDEMATASEEHLTLVFSPGSSPFEARWRNNGLSADYLADYLANLFPDSEMAVGDIGRKKAIKSAVSYIANELLENSMKFNHAQCPYQISVALSNQGEKLIFWATNSVRPEVAQEFQNFIKELLAHEPSELYINQLENSSLDEMSRVSRLGFLILLNDYFAKLGWKFETAQQDPTAIAVTTMVQLAV